RVAEYDVDHPQTDDLVRSVDAPDTKLRGLRGTQHHCLVAGLRRSDTASVALDPARTAGFAGIHGKIEDQCHFRRTIANQSPAMDQAQAASILQNRVTCDAAQRTGLLTRVDLAQMAIARQLLVSGHLGRTPLSHEHGPGYHS